MHLADVLGEARFAVISGYLDRALGGETVTYEVELPVSAASQRHIMGTYIPDRAPDGSVRRRTRRPCRFPPRIW